MPGSPAKVMCTQFLYYVKLNRRLSRVEERKAQVQRMIYDAVKQAQFKLAEEEQRKKKLSRKKETEGASTSSRIGTTSRGQTVTAA